MLKPEIAELIRHHYATRFSQKPFQPGIDPVRYAGRVFDEKEIQNLVESGMDFWLTEGRFAEMFTDKISRFLNHSAVLLTNSGSSANLLALSALTSEKLGEKRLIPGDEVITVAAGFPSTVTPIIQNQLVPVFVDVDLNTYNINIDGMKKARTSRTKCVFIAHTLGNPFSLDAVTEFCKEHGLWLIEDNCDSFGSKYQGRYTGTFGHLSTLSFYPAHHITTGEGGAVITNDPMLANIVRSFRDWGRDCWCAGGMNDTCGARFTGKHGDLPSGYDHKYVYSEAGYNLKMTDMQAAIGCAQMDKLETFCRKRKKNFNIYQTIFKPFEKHFILPEATANSDPAWFAYPLTVRESASFDRNTFVQFLSSRLIETRYLFAGNITKQPFMKKSNYRIPGRLDHTDTIMNSTFFLGTYPGMTPEMLDYIGKVVNQFFLEQGASIE